MSSHIFAFDEPFYDSHQNTNSVLQFTDESTDLPLFSDFNPIALTASLSDSSIDSIILQEISDDHRNNNGGATPHHQQGSNPDEAQSLDQIAKTLLLSTSPPSNQLENLSIRPLDTHLVASGYAGYSSVKTEESSAQSQISFDSSSYNNDSSSCYFLGGGSSNSFDGGDLGGMIGFLQRSYSSNSFDGKPAGFLGFQPRFGSLIEHHSSSPTTAAAAAASFQQVITYSPDSTTFINGGAGQMRRVCSTGDLPKVRSGQTTEGEQQQQRLSSSPLGTEGGGGGGCFMEEANFKVGRYSADERKERIDRYRAKRTQRNFNKTIKYACRKTLADNRPRIRGRFARNDDTGEIPIPKACTAAPPAANYTITAPLSFIRHHHHHHRRRYEDEDDLSWVTELHDDEEEQGGGGFPSNFGGGMAQFHLQYQDYCGY